MQQKKIFLSYRRDDRPGYVGRLKDELEKAFGTELVFRDVENISGGSQWKKVIEENLRQSAALVLIIGPRWGEIWEQRRSDPDNYIALELQRAKELKIPIIPVSLNNAHIPEDLDISPVEWLREMQIHDISDVQSRWKYDIQGLINILDQQESISRLTKASSSAEEQKSGNGKKIILAAAGVGGFLLILNFIPDSSIDDYAPPLMPSPVDQSTRSGDQSPDLTGTLRSQNDNTLNKVNQHQDIKPDETSVYTPEPLPTFVSREISPGFGEVRAIIDDPDGYTNVRSRQGSQHRIIDRVAEGEVFFTIPQQAVWWPVRTRSNKMGYMHRSRIRLEE